MISDWQTVLLGELCTLTKGKAPTLKTPPGDYPLVVTGPEPLTSKDFQFEGEAVCIPMVSSTGHGHASLKRVHYVSGRFAVANIITAAVVDDPSKCDTKFLYHFLQHFKDDLIVTRMQGTANVSLSQKILATVPVRLPPLDEQRRIVNLIGSIDNAIEAANTNAELAGGLYGAILNGLDQDGPMVPIKDVVKVAKAGGTPSRKQSQYFMGEIPWVKSGEVERDSIDSSEEHISGEGLRSSSTWIVPPGSTLVAMYGQGNTKGKAGFVTSPVTTNQAVLALVPNEEVIVPAYLLHAIRSRTDALRKKAVGAAQPNLSKGLIIEETIPVPTRQRQSILVALCSAATETASRSREVGHSLRALRKELLTALLSGAHAMPESYDELIAERVA